MARSGRNNMKSYRFKTLTLPEILAKVLRGNSPHETLEKTLNQRSIDQPSQSVSSSWEPFHLQISYQLELEPLLPAGHCNSTGQLSRCTWTQLLGSWLKDPLPGRKFCRFSLRVCFNFSNKSLGCTSLLCN